MTKNMLMTMLTTIVTMLVERLEPEALRKWADFGLDMLEDYIKQSETTLDDKIAIPIIKAIRQGFSIPDNDA